MGGGGGTSTATALDINQQQLAQFMQSGTGKQYAKDYNPRYLYAQVGDSIQAYDPNEVNSQHLSSYGQVGPDVSAFINAFRTWVGSQNTAQANWQNYSDQVAANEGGEGDNTITTGAAVSQRNALLGALSNAGNAPGSSNPGLGVNGQAVKQLGRP